MPAAVGGAVAVFALAGALELVALVELEVLEEVVEFAFPEVHGENIVFSVTYRHAASKPHAGELGANAVIGVRYDATEIAPGITEVLCYGTAVVVEKV